MKSCSITLSTRTDNKGQFHILDSGDEFVAFENKKQEDETSLKTLPDGKPESI